MALWVHVQYVTPALNLAYEKYKYLYGGTLYVKYSSHKKPPTFLGLRYSTLTYIHILVSKVLHRTVDSHMIVLIRDRCDRSLSYMIEILV